MFCTECGARFHAQETFCTECGATRRRSETAPPAPGGVGGSSEAGGSRRRTVGWTAASFVIGLAAVVGFGLVVTSGSDGPSGTEAVPPPSPSVSGVERATASPGSSATRAAPPSEQSPPAFPSPGATAQPVNPQAVPTVSPTPVVVPQLEPGVQEALDLNEEQAAQVLLEDEAAALNSLRAGRWYPFLSSKCAGMGAFAPLDEPLDMGPPGRIGMPDGFGEEYSFLGSPRILALQRYYESRFGPQVVNATTQGLGRRTTYEGLCGPYPMWITLNAGVSFSQPSGALTWCRENGFITGECGAFPAFMPDEVVERI